MATGHKTGMVNIWNLDKRSMILQISASSSEVLSLCFSPSGDRLATGGVGLDCKAMERFYWGAGIDG